MQDQYSRTQLLLGAEAMTKLHDSRVAVFGVGGVGGYTVEALARSGVGALDLIDDDKVCLTNLNRQIIALHSTLGKPKVEVMKERILDINPACQVNTFQTFYLPENADDFDLTRYDYVIDCVDTVTAKLELAQRCHNLGVPCISSMGTANKLDPTKFVVTDLSKTSMCPLARILRKELRSRGIQHLQVVYSTEQAMKPREDLPEDLEETSKRQLPSSNSFVPAAAGLVLAGAVIRALAGMEPHG